ncbi:zinc-dependent alcohol dehydrogenase family protein [Christiangramia crocea]|uniref:Zinc-dependent alcohol dehydrogenase family protein n=1 Tax=Christiangramia crocea TaxID=2904124 RepID=A0A9X1UY31_9FLAO|nr:zinc-dependent alcohol dehydrogenase family protein [Gramella crocea]MCG9971674.1 zinc-dependent alcohol dehydrogenase family protein [Gramella crocea]
MNAMVLKQCTSLETNQTPLLLEELPVPTPGPNEVLIKVSACGVCHTELDEIEGRTPPAFFPVILGHQVVGIIISQGLEVKKSMIGQRVGVAWIYSSCGKCEFCKSGRENLCSAFKATGRDKNGGYAEYMTASEKFIYPIPDFFSDVEAAPLLCAGAIGNRSIALSNLKNGQNLGLMGFGASAHLVLKMVRDLFPSTKVFVFSRNSEERSFADQLGASWSGDISDKSPEKLHSIIDTTPVWKPVVNSLENLEKGGRLVINAIRKENQDQNLLLKLSYEKHLWMEKEIKTVANVTGKDVKDFLKFAAASVIKPVYQEYRLKDANKALMDLKNKSIKGAKVLKIH